MFRVQHACNMREKARLCNIITGKPHSEAAAGDVLAGIVVDNLEAVVACIILHASECESCGNCADSNIPPAQNGKHSKNMKTHKWMAFPSADGNANHLSHMESSMRICLVPSQRGQASPIVRCMGAKNHLGMPRPSKSQTFTR
jgi:hypothetical protein